MDLLIELDQRIVAVECKRTERPGEDDVRGIRKLREMYGDERVRAAFVACTTPAPHEIGPAVTALPGWTTWPLD